jgi:ribosome-associated protein
LNLTPIQEYDPSSAPRAGETRPAQEDCTIDTHNIVRIAAEAALEKKATELTLLKVEGLTSFCDWFILCNGSNKRQIQAIGQGIVRSLKDHGIKPLGVEGMEQSRWILIDLGDILVHVFDDPMRGYYDLDGLWVDAPRVSLEDLGVEDPPQALAAPAK